MRTYANLYYFRKICHIGGTEQFLYEIAKKYHSYDITILYDESDFDQLIRLSKLVRCIRRDQNTTYHAKRAFYNFNIDAIEQIEADEHIFVSHAIYQELKYYPPIDHPKITKLIGVSKYAVKKIKEQCKLQSVNKPVALCYNPLSFEKTDRTELVKLISATRLDDVTKGGERTLKLIEALDRQSERLNIPYLWLIFTNKPSFQIGSPNVVLLPGKINIRPYIKSADWLVQLSNNMESYCYSINEAWCLGTGVVRTPMTVVKEFNVPNKAELVCDWGMDNVDEIAEKILTTKSGFEYAPPKDGWARLLIKEKSDYKPGKLTVKPIMKYYDLELKQEVNSETEPFDIDIDRARMLIGKGLVKIV